MFEIYTKPGCPFCDRAKDLITAKGFQYVERVLDVGQVKEPNVEYFTVPQLHQLVPGARTVPQIFRDGQLIGGFEALRLNLK